MIAKNYKDFRVYINREDGSMVGYFQMNTGTRNVSNFSVTYTGEGNTDEILDQINAAKEGVFQLWNGVQFNGRNFNVLYFWINKYIKF